MENIQRKLEKDIDRLSRTGASRTRRWTLMLIRNDGRTFSIRGFKGLILFVAAAMLLTAGTVAVLYTQYQNSFKEAEQLRHSLQAARATSKSLKHQKEVLIAQLAIAKTLATQKPAAETTVEDASSPDEGSPPLPAPAAEPASAAADDPSIESDTPEEPILTPPEPDAAGAPVGVEDLTVFFDALRKRLRIKFVIRKTDTSLESVSGRTFVVLKPEDADQSRWLPMPPVSLDNGIPLLASRGQFFSIARFKPITLEKADVDHPEQYQQADIFVFSPDRKLIFQQEFQIEVKKID